MDSFDISYEISPVKQQGLNELVDIFVSVKNKNNQPLSGKKVNLKIVKQTANKFKSIKTNAKYDGFLNSIISLNEEQKGGCIWRSIFKPNQIFKAKNFIQNFCLSLTKQPLCLIEDGLQIKEDLIIRGVRGFKIIASPTGDYIILDKNKIYLIYPALSNFIKKIDIKEDIIDGTVDNNGVIWLLTKNKLISIKKDQIKTIDHSFDCKYIHFFQNKIYLISDFDCSVINTQGKVIDGFSLSKKPITYFHSYQNKIIFCTDNFEKVFIYDLITKESKEIILDFITYSISNILIDEELSIYISFENFIYKVCKTELPFLDILFEDEMVLESFTLKTAGKGNIRVYAFNHKNGWLAWDQETDLSLKEYIIPIENKIKGIKIEWEGTSIRTISEIQKFYIQGSNNFGFLEKDTALTNKDGIATFSYICRKFKYPEKFVAIVR